MTPAIDAAEAVLRRSASCAEGATAADAAKSTAISRRRMGRMLSPGSGRRPHCQPGLACGLSEPKVVHDDPVDVRYEGDRCGEMYRVESAQRDRVKVSGIGQQRGIRCDQREGGENLVGVPADQP